MAKGSGVIKSSSVKPPLDSSAGASAPPPASIPATIASFAAPGAAAGAAPSLSGPQVPPIQPMGLAGAPGAPVNPFVGGPARGQPNTQWFNKLFGGGNG
jgi:hypothetical protein